MMKKLRPIYRAVGVPGVDDKAVVVGSRRSQDEVRDAVSDVMQSELVQFDAVNVV